MILVSVTGRVVRRAALMAALLIAPSALSAQDAANPLVGFWQGTLRVGAVALRLVLHVQPAPGGGLTGDLDSIDQGAMDIPVDSISIAGDSVRLVLPRIGGLYRGAFDADHRTITGTWTQGPGSLPLTFTKSQGQPAALSRPQEPKPPFPYRVEEVVITNPGANITLAGTLTVPSGAGPHPAAVLITGSGPQDRDESLMGHRPFLVLADHLTRRGIAVLRMDDRGIGKSTGRFAAATMDDFATDIEAAVRYLRQRPEIAPGEVGLIGHSEGGLIAPLVAVAIPDAVDFVVLLAAPGTPGSRILVRQGELLARASGVDSALVAKNGRAQARVYEVLRTERDSATAARRIDAITDSLFAELTPAERAQLGATREGVRSAQQALFTPWFRRFVAYDPAPTLRRVRQPVLAITGSTDLQVPAEENLAAIREALAAGGNRDVTTVLAPNLNHLFQHATTGLPQEYGQIEETMAPEVLDRIASWVRARTAEP